MADQRCFAYDGEADMGPAMTTTSRATEWPTVILIATVYVAVGLLVWTHGSLPWWVILPIGAYCTALFGSLQHEVLHGHPTGSRLINEALVFPTLHFWLPYGRYKKTHLIHHNDSNLTDPRLDPESYYMLPEHWAALPGIKQTLYTFNNTLFGRMLIGPAVSVLQFWGAEFRDILKGDDDKARDWAWFAVSCALSLWFIVGLAGMPLWKYVLLIAYPGVSLALIRSYCEHRAAENHNHRTIIVEASPFWSLLFLYNNLHVAHHSKPAMAWYKLPAYYRAERNALITRNAGYLMNGYSEIFQRYFFRAKEPVAHPHPEWLKQL